MIVDTVGFINKIPHSLIEAFKSTLEEVSRADLLLHLVDLANPLYEEQIQIIEKVFGEIGAGEIPTLLVPNKVDPGRPVPLARLKINDVGAGLSDFGIDRRRCRRITCRASAGSWTEPKERFEANFTPAQSRLVALLRERGRIVEEMYDGESFK